MNSDERIDALTQSLELLSRMHQDSEVRFQGYFDHMTTLISRLTGVSESLAIIARDHETRINGLENRNG